MHYFTIRDMENLLGIKAHTLRIWEQRYHFFTPKRKSSKHRYYDNDDLKQLLRIAFLYHNGWKISKIAQMKPEEMEEAVRNSLPQKENQQQYVLPLLEHAVDFDERNFSGLLDHLIRLLGFEECIINVCFPFLQRVGMLWVTNRVIPAQEHFSSYIIQNKIIAETEQLPAAAEPAEILLFTPQGEFHELPLLFLNYMLRKWGWRVLYLGKNVHYDLLQQFTTQEHLRFLMLHLITNLMQIDSEVYLEKICRMFPQKTIVASGSAVHQVQRSFVNLLLLRSDAEIYNFIRQGNNGG